MRIRILSLVMVILLLFTSMPVQAFAEVVESNWQNEELFKEELRKAVDEKQYPNGLFELLSTRMNTSEDLSYVEVAIVRKGGTSGKANVTFKAIDVTAKYGEDYTISVPKGLFNQTLDENPDAKPLIESFESVETSVVDSVYSAAYSTYPTSGLDYQVLQGINQDTDDESSGLRAARDSFTGTQSERKTWREVDQETKETVLQQHNELYQGVPGVTYTFEFADGEYIKKLRFNTIDDKISEDEEQVMFALLEPVGGVLGESVSGFMNIQDNEVKEKVEFEIVERQIDVDRSMEYAEITVRRTAGFYRYGIIQVGTAALSAQPNVDYEPIAVELRFIPGQETQKVRVPLLEGVNGNELQFLIKLDPESPNLAAGGNDRSLVTIKAQQKYFMMQRLEASPLLSDDSILTAVPKTINVRIKSIEEDMDARVTPKIWTSTNSSIDLESQYVGSMWFGWYQGISERTFSMENRTNSWEDNIYFLQNFDENFKDHSKVYLWGYKIERLGGEGDPYYYVNMNYLNLFSLSENTLEDVNGKKIPFSEVLMRNNTVVVQPVFKQRTGFVVVDNDSYKGDFVPGTFKSGEAVRVGMMDTVNIRLNAKDGYSITGYKNADINIRALELNYYEYIWLVMESKSELETFDERNLKVVDLQAVSEYPKSYNPYQTPVYNPRYYEYKPEFRPVEGLNINPSFPGELDFSPNRNLSIFQVEYSPSSLKVMADPQSAGKDKGSVAYFPEEGSYQIGDKDNPMIISPVQFNKAYTLSGLPDDGYRILWKDWSGDLNEDGIIDYTESSNMEKYAGLFDRKSVNGSFFNYAVGYDKSLIYYSFEPKTDNVAKGTIMGRVFLRGGTVLQNSETLTANTVERPLADVTVNVNGHTVSTDKDGIFLIKSSDFTTNEYHTLVINYNGTNYTGYVNVNASAKIVIEEYDSFIPYNFSALNSTGKVDLKIIDNRDTTYKFNFYAKANKPGISADKALIRIYSKEKVQRGEPIEVTSINSVFSFDLNPKTRDVMAGDSMTIQFVDQNGVEHTEHEVGFIFKKYLNTFSLLNSFKSPAKPAVDLIGTVDASLDLGLAGAIDKYMEKSEKEWIVRFGFSDSWEKSLKDGSKVKDDKPAEEALKDAAKAPEPGESDAEKEIEIKDTAGKAIDKENKEKKSASVTSDMKYGLSTSLYLKMIVDEDKASPYYGYVYFNEMILSVTVSGYYSKRVERMTPVGVTVYVDMVLGGEVTAMLVVEQYNAKKFHLKGEGNINFSNVSKDDPDRDYTMYGKFILRPSIHITAGAKVAGADLSIRGDATFNFDFTSSGSSTGSVSLTSEIKLEALFFTHTWNLYAKTWSLYSTGVASGNLLGDTNYLYSNAENYEVIPRDYLDNRGVWQENAANMLMGSSGLGVTADNEQILQTGIYPNPYTLLATIGENQQLLVFLDDSLTHDVKNRTHLYYSIYNGSTWSIPQMVDNDGTPDGLPWISDMGDKVLVAWSSSVALIDADETVIGALNNRNIKGRFFDKAGKTFGEVQEITHETAQDQYSDSEPYIAYWKDEAGNEDLMITYTKNEYRATGGVSDQDAVIGDVVNPYYSTLAYRFYDFGKNMWDTSGDTGNGYYGQGFMSVSDYVYAEDSSFYISGDDSLSGYWSRLPNASEIGIRQLPGSDPLIADSNSAGYKDYAILAYVLDLDTNMGTTADRELFIQLYSFKDKKFHTPIRITNDVIGEYDLEFVKVGDTVYLYYISDGDIMSMDMGKLIQEGLLQYEISGKTVFIQNKSVGAYVKPEVAVRHSFDIRIDENGNEIIENEAPIDEFMVKANANNVYIVWGENEITYRDGIDPHSKEAVLPENHYRENHIYAARRIIGEGTEWTYPVKLTEGKGANYNDLDFEILQDGSLRTVFVKSFSEVMDVAGKPMSVANENKSILMTADFDVNTRDVDVKLEKLPFVKPLESASVEIGINNKSLSALSGALVELYQSTGDLDVKVGEQIIDLRGGEKASTTFTWQAPENLENIKLKVLVKYGDEIVCSNEQSVIAKSVINILDAQTMYEGRNRLRIIGTAKNNGNISTNSAQIMAEVNGISIGTDEQISFKIGETRYFDFYVNIQPELFKTTVNEDGSVVETLDLTVHSESGIGVNLAIERNASKEDIDTINNINTFELQINGRTSPQNIYLYRGSLLDIQPSLTYNDETKLKPRLVYISSNNEVVDFSQGYMRLSAKNTGTATITAYALPQISEIILSKNYFKRVDNFLTLTEGAIKVRSFNVNVVESSGEDTSGTPTVNEPTESVIEEVTIDGENVKITSELKAVTDSTGNASAVISDYVISNALKKILELSANGGQAGANFIEIKVNVSSDVNSLENIISTTSIKEMLDSKIKALTISTPLADIMLNDEALEDLSHNAAEDVRIKVSKVDPSTLPEKVKQELKEYPLYNFDITVANKNITQFKGDVTISIPYTPKQNEDVDSIIIYYINDNNELEIVKNCKYNSESGMVTFKTNHFSRYAVGYNKIFFMDVAESSWYADAVDFIAAREITAGTGDGNFSPEDKLTRAQLIVMLMRLYNIAPDVNPADNFSDAGNDYYTTYLAAAKRLGISVGTGNNKFTPESEISRQEMLCLLHNILKYIDELPEGKGGKVLDDFSDAESTASWAKEAVRLFVEAGVVAGSYGKLDPTAVVSRAQIAQIFYNVISR